MRARAPRLALLAATAHGLPGALIARSDAVPPSPPVMPQSAPTPADPLAAAAAAAARKLPPRPVPSAPTSAPASASASASAPASAPAPAPAPVPAPVPTPAPASLADMVPITHELLTQHYATFPDPVVAEELVAQRADIARLHRDVLGPGTSAAREEVDDILAEELPHGLDNNMYKARCACEEAAGRVAEVPELADFTFRLQRAAAQFEGFQQKQREHVQTVIDEFLPQDFRGALFTAAKQRSEKTNAQAVDDLLASGGSVRDKYNLLWEQQWRRRENLAMVGNATGVWRWLVRYLAGVPQPLLIFAKNINSPHGPTDALRAKFGGALKELAKFAIELNALSAATVLAQKKDKHVEVKKQMEKSLTLYEKEVEKFVELLQEVIVNSPFFIKPELIKSSMPDQA